MGFLAGAPAACESSLRESPRAMARPAGEGAARRPARRWPPRRPRGRATGARAARCFVASHYKIQNTQYKMHLAYKDTNDHH